MGTCIQKIFFGPPGCGKSYRVRQEAEKELGIDKASSNMIETAFHPEYGYGDFVAKLLPQTGSRKVAYALENLPSEHLNGATLTQTTNTPTIEYRIHAGPLIKALARAYADEKQHVLLVIDEINRGNCAQIFGDIFQLLDRDADGWSEYAFDPSDLVMDALKQELNNIGKQLENLSPKLKVEDANKKVTGYKLRLPPKLSLIGTMNTSDESVYYMDTAFKRRWDFEYMPWDGTSSTHVSQKNATIENYPHTWHQFLEKLNAFIVDVFKGRNVDDKLVGIWFLKVLNLPQLTPRTEAVEKRIVFSEKLVTLLTTLGTLGNNPKQKDWVKHFSSATIFPEENVKGKKKSGYLQCDSIKKILEDEYKIDCVNFDFKTDATYLAANLIKHIISRNLATLIEPDEVGCLGEIVGEVQSAKPRIEHAAIKNKLMFFLWDNVFSRDHTPLYKLLKDGGENAEPRTFGEFTEKVEAFITGVMAQKLEG